MRCAIDSSYCEGSGGSFGITQMLLLAAAVISAILYYRETARLLVAFALFFCVMMFMAYLIKYDLRIAFIPFLAVPALAALVFLYWIYTKISATRFSKLKASDEVDHVPTLSIAEDATTLGKAIIRCPECSCKLRVPRNRLVVVTCKHCRHEFNCTA